MFHNYIKAKNPAPDGRENFISTAIAPTRELAVGHDQSTVVSFEFFHSV